MKQILISFSMVLWMTIIAFITVAVGFDSLFTVPFLLLLAVVQVVFQLYYFMHLKDEHHGTPRFFIFCAIIVSIPIIIAMMFLP